MSTTELARAEVVSTGLMPAMSPSQGVDRYNQLVHFVQQIMKPDKDFGVIPGTTKPTLLKPGAEKLCSFFGLAPAFVEVRVVEDWTNGFFFYCYKAVLSRNGEVVAESLGSCNSKEKKYRYRVSDRKCPSCGRPNIRKSAFPPKGRPSAKPGWYCHAKSGGCGANYDVDDPAITEQETGQIENPDIYDAVNTIQKMSQKRALIAAVLIAANASEFFTQDLEDLGPAADTDGETVNRKTGEVRDDAPDLSRDEDFLFLWDAATEGKGLDLKTGRSLLGAICRKRAIDFFSADVATRQRLINDLQAKTPADMQKFRQAAQNNAAPGGGSPDVVTGSGPDGSSSSEPAPEEEIDTGGVDAEPPEGVGDGSAQEAFNNWYVTAEELWAARGGDPKDFKRRMGQVFVKHRVKGKEHKLTPEQRAGTIAAINDRAGFFA